jgi:hypothetical protein
MGNGNGKKLKAAKTKAEVVRTIFAGLNTVVGITTLAIIIYVNFLR